MTANLRTSARNVRMKISWISLWRGRQPQEVPWPSYHSWGSLAENENSTEQEPSWRTDAADILWNLIQLDLMLEPTPQLCTLMSQCFPFVDEAHQSWFSITCCWKIPHWDRLAHKKTSFGQSNPQPHSKVRAHPALPFLAFRLFQKYMPSWDHTRAQWPHSLLTEIPNTAFLLRLPLTHPSQLPTASLGCHDKLIHLLSPYFYFALQYS